MMMETEQVQAYALCGKSHDCGSKIGYLKAIIEHAVRRDEFSNELMQFITKLAK